MHITAQTLAALLPIESLGMRLILVLQGGGGGGAKQQVPPQVLSIFSSQGVRVTQGLSSCASVILVPVEIPQLF